MSWTPGTSVRLETERYVLRSLTRADVSQRYIDWTGDAELMAGLNRAPNTVTREQLEQYIASFDNRTRFQLGVFSKRPHEHLGVFTLEVDTTNALARTNVLIGERDHWGTGVVTEARAAVLDFLFEHVGVEKVWGTPLARNFAAVYNYQAQGFRCEGVLRAHARAPDGTRVDQFIFAILKDEWQTAHS